jgi:V/A-type H+-transporting ATPase subunit D
VAVPGTQVVATRTNLMRAKQDLRLALEGHRLLDQKREVLIMELLQVLAALREQARTTREMIARGYKLLDDAEFAAGTLPLAAQAEGPTRESSLSALERSVMGVVLPSLTYERAGVEPGGGIGDSVPEADEGAAVLRDSVEQIVRWAELDLVVYRLAAEVKKTQRRVNALGEVFIPETRARVARITAALEEAEREEFFRRKRVKSKLRKRQDEGTDAA